jgi:hypothetical protein
MNTKRQTMKDLETKALAARDKEVKKAKAELYSEPRIPGANRATLRKLYRRQIKIMNQSRKREIAHAKRAAKKDVREIVKIIDNVQTIREKNEEKIRVMLNEKTEN